MITFEMFYSDLIVFIFYSLYEWSLITNCYERIWKQTHLIPL